MFSRPARGLLDLCLAVLCLWCAGYHTPAGALVRRGGGVPVQVLRFAGYQLDLDRRKVEAPGGKPVELTRTEFDLLAFFVRERERVLRRDEILDAVWGREVVVDPHTVDNFVSSLKRKLGWNSASRFALQTVRGVGYRLEIEP